MSARAHFVTLCFGALGLACGSSNNGGTSGTVDASVPIIDAPGGSGGSVDANGTFVEAPHRAFPQVIYQGGPLLTSTYVVSILFPGDSLASDLTTFGSSLTMSTWWDEIRVGLCEGNGTTCVGDGPPGETIVLTTPASATYTDDQIQTFLVGLINAGTVPEPDPSTIYNIYFPATTTITSFGEQSCIYFDAYHSATGVGTKPVYYSVIPECAPYNPPGIAPIDLLQNDTLSASHEIIETASDGSATEYSFYPDVNDPQNWGWLDFEDGEVADLCVDAYGLGGDETIENNGYMVQRIWSIPNATAGKNPCVPIPTGEVYFNAAPTTSVLIMNVGDTQTVEVDAWSDAPMAAWTLNGQDETDSNTSYISISFVGGTLGTDGSDIKVQNGDKVMATVKLLADPAALDGEDAYGVFVSYTGTANEPSHDHYWPFVVMTPAEASDGGISERRIARARDRHLHRVPRHLQLPRAR